MLADGGRHSTSPRDTPWEAAVGAGGKNALFLSLDRMQHVKERLYRENASLCSAESTVGREQSVPEVAKINT